MPPARHEPCRYPCAQYRAARCPDEPATLSQPFLSQPFPTPAAQVPWPHDLRHPHPRRLRRHHPPSGRRHVGVGRLVHLGHGHLRHRSDQGLHPRGLGDVGRRRGNAVRHRRGLRRRRKRADHRVAPRRRPGPGGQGRPRHQVHAVPMEAQRPGLVAEVAAGLAVPTRRGLGGPVPDPRAGQPPFACGTGRCAGRRPRRGPGPCGGRIQLLGQGDPLDLRRVGQARHAPRHESDRVLVAPAIPRDVRAPRRLRRPRSRPHGLLADRTGPAHRQILCRRPATRQAQLLQAPDGGRRRCRRRAARDRRGPWRKAPQPGRPQLGHRQRSRAHSRGQEPSPGGGECRGPRLASRWRRSRPAGPGRPSRDPIAGNRVWQHG